MKPSDAGDPTEPVKHSGESTANSPAHFASRPENRPPADSDLARVAAACPELPEAIRRAILALVDTAGTGQR